MTAIEALQSLQQDTAPLAGLTQAREIEIKLANISREEPLTGLDPIGFDEVPTGECVLAIAYGELETARAAMASREAEYQRLSTHAYLRAV